MSDDVGRARKMEFLAKVEQTREIRCRLLLREAEAAWSLATSEAEDAAAAALRAREERNATLRAAYDGLLGTRTARTIHALRITEQHLLERETTTLKNQTAAEAAAADALAACQTARDALQLASLRSQRRGELAATLCRKAALAAQNAEEDATADELMDRLGGAR